ncbi:MAG: fumarylacetoacetate hydrolase family protein [Deltaproteobacteria bacterium]|nr:fumarylacetoacetate hydrolase family protein [Deltaproteobacteria bacterium]
MRIAQYYRTDQIRVGIIEDDSLVPLDFQGDMLDFIESDRVCRPIEERVPLDQIRYAPCISRPSKIIGIGLNYLDHIREGKGEIPESPLVFAKFPNTLAAHKDPITWNPELTKKVDFEAELAVVMGKTVYNCSEEEAEKAVFGYTCANDVSARDLQFGDKQWVRGKTLDSFCPLGPWIVTPEDIGNPHHLAIRSMLNGQIMQESNTRHMLFKVPQLVSFLSRNFTLASGDVILTGTPHGVGAFRQPSVYMNDGDEIVIEIEKIGRLINTCKTQPVPIP